MKLNDCQIKSLLTPKQHVLVYGLGPDRERPSHFVPAYLRDQGWTVSGVYPRLHDVGAFTIYSSLEKVPTGERKFLNVFRRSEHIPALVDEVLALGGTEILWLQLGITHLEAEARAERAGLKVISNRCLMVDHRRALIEGVRA